jgi:hypothetical protein
MNLIEDKAIFWQGHIDNFKQSGLSRREYCKRNGLNPSTFSSWIKGLTAKTTEPIDFIAVNNPTHEEKRPINSTNSMLQLLLPNGVRLGLGEQANEQLIQQVLSFAGSL